ncbi:MAG: efflux RND transporter periplasmic adaptor subunit [Thermodesulfobacteriota bacterium]|nr:efflux RND transporter periplasmic adaptor subunit [Thermodesulfobacteriota bacterium]
MSKRILRWFLILVAITAGVVGVWHYTRPDPIAVEVKPVSRGTVERTVANTRAGTVKACRRAKLSPGIGGQIAKLPVKKGDSVTAGQLLLEIWNADLAAQAELVQREITAARSRRDAICLKADVAKRNADRLVKLLRGNAVSEERVDNAIAEADTFMAECQAAWAEVKAREAQMAVVQANLARTRLEAPFDGIIAEINGELYEYVTPSPVGIPTPPAVDIIDVSCFYVAAPIDEVDAADVRVGMLARITMDAFRDRRFEGHVRRISDYVLDVEKQARTVEVEVSFGRPEEISALLPGYSVDIEVILEARSDVVRVPTEAIMEGRRVFVFQPDQGTVALRDIRIGISNWDQTEVLEGLTPDELVVVNVDNPELEPGATVVRIEERP